MAQVTAAKASAERASSIRRALWIVLALNVAVTLIKLGVGVGTGSLSAIADGVQSIIDSASNVIGLLGIWISLRPPDANHPYGHHKYEAVAGMGIGTLSVVAAYEIGKNVIARLMGDALPLSTTPLTIGLMSFTFAVNFGITVYETRLGQRLQSPVLAADAAQTRANLFVTVSVVASLVAARFGLNWLDSIVALIVVAVILRSAFEVWRSTANILTDVSAADSNDVERIALSVPSVRRVEDIRSRGHANAVYLDLHVHVDPNMGTEQAHSVATEVERRLAEQIPGMVDAVVHVEPTPAEAVASLWQNLSLTARNLADGLGLGLHDLHAHLEADGRYSLEAHLEVDARFDLAEAHALADEFERRVCEALPALGSITTHLEPLPIWVPGEIGLADGSDAMRRCIVQAADEIAGPGACHELELHNVNGHLAATLHVTQPAQQQLTQAHALAEKVEQAVHACDPRIGRVVVHVEPPGRES